MNLTLLEKELLEQLKLAVARAHDLEIILKEAQEEFGLTIFICGSIYDEVKARTAIAHATAPQPAPELPLTELGKSIMQESEQPNPLL